MLHNESLPPDAPAATTEESDSLYAELTSDDDGGVSVCERGRRKFVQLSGLGAGAAFVLVPNSELIHSAIRAVLGVGGVECC